MNNWSLCVTLNISEIQIFLPPIDFHQTHIKKQTLKNERQNNKGSWSLDCRKDWGSYQISRHKVKHRIRETCVFLFYCLAVVSSSSQHSDLNSGELTGSTDTGTTTTEVLFTLYWPVLSVLCLAVKKSCLPLNFWAGRTQNHQNKSGFVVPQNWHMYCMITAA